MKKRIVKPEIDFVEFDANDIIVTSGGFGKIPLADKVEVEAEETSPARSSDWVNLAWNQ